MALQPQQAIIHNKKKGLKIKQKQWGTTNIKSQKWKLLF